jgi:hypothetical protein
MTSAEVTDRAVVALEALNRREMIALAGAGTAISDQADVVVDEISIPSGRFDARVGGDPGAPAMMCRGGGVIIDGAPVTRPRTDIGIVFQNPFRRRPTARPTPSTAVPTAHHSAHWFGAGRWL